MASHPPKLLEQVRQAIRARHYSRRTEEAYAFWIRRFILFHGKQHPRDVAAKDIAAFQTALAVRDKVASSTQSQALSAVLFCIAWCCRRTLARSRMCRGLERFIVCRSC